MSSSVTSSPLFATYHLFEIMVAITGLAALSALTAGRIFDESTSVLVILYLFYLDFR